MFQIKRYFSGGIMTNYYCSSRCKHCLYACSPDWPKDYLDVKQAQAIFTQLQRMGCSSIHIGGGEPFLNFEQLITICRLAQQYSINIEYIETNSSWFQSYQKAEALLNELSQTGIHTLLVSISPFHNEYIPFDKVKGVIKACQSSGMQVLPWVMDFYQDINQFDGQKKHSIKEYEQKFGSSFLCTIPNRYWIHYGGRSIAAFQDCYEKQPYEYFLEHSQGCTELTDTSHFHIDLFGNYIPGLCSGLAIGLNDLFNEISDEQYPILNLLYYQGIAGLFQFAARNYKFTPKQHYLNKCHFCLDIRQYLIKETKLETKELKPVEFYDHL
ncbi:MAG: radical SAM protein [Spirochaetes bacterium]|nr:radical SAM protein [Spirochaetota bacterium]